MISKIDHDSDDDGISFDNEKSFRLSEIITMMPKTKMAGLQGQEVQETHQIGEKFHWNHLTSCGQNVEAIPGIQL